MIKVMSVFGTRPEAIKMCPLVLELEKKSEIESIVCLTGQHREMLVQVMKIFGIKEKYNLDIMHQDQTLTTITTTVLERIEPILKKERPDLVLVHGDTSTSFAVALAAFYQQIPVGHVEAGLRTYNIYSPFPEEMNRNLTGKIAELHFAPTINNRKNLEKENIVKNVFVTGNTVIDALKITVKENYQFKEPALQQLKLDGKKCILLTAHRRENLGQPLENICNAVKYLAEEYSDLEFIYPVHLNPLVQNTVRGILSEIVNVHLIPPIDVEDMHNIMAKSFLIMTDSGGIQEEAPACGVPVLVLRTETERPEAVEAGTAKVVGTREKDIVREVKLLVDNQDEYEKMAKAINPYGDGKSSEKIVKHILEWKRND